MIRDPSSRSTKPPLCEKPRGWCSNRGDPNCRQANLSLASGAEIEAASADAGPRIEGLAHLTEQYESGVHLWLENILSANHVHSGTVPLTFRAPRRSSPLPQDHRVKPCTVAADHDRRAGGKVFIDYAFHLILMDPTGEELRENLPRLGAERITSFKDLHDPDLLRNATQETRQKAAGSRAAS